MSLRVDAAIGIALTIAALAGCGGGESRPAGPPPGPTAAEPPGAGAAREPAAGREAVTAIRPFTRAANRGDLDAVLAATTRDIRFDSAGRLFRGPAGIREFIGGEVIPLGGRYRELSARTQADRGIVEYDFRTRGGGRERFTYACRARQGRLSDCVGRYV